MRRKLQKKTVCLVFSGSLPRFPGDFSGSFIPGFIAGAQNRYRAALPHIVYIAPSHPACRPSRGLGRRVYFRWWRASGETWGHGGFRPSKALLLKPWAWVKLAAFMGGFARALWLTRRRLYRRRIIVWSHFLVPAGIALAPVCRYLGVPQAATGHSSDWHFLYAMGAPGRWLLRHLLARLAFCQTITQAAARKARQTAPASASKIQTHYLIPRFVRLRRANRPPISGPQSEGRAPAVRLLYLGSLLPVKGIGALLSSLAGLPADELERILRGVYLAIVGAGPDENELRARIAIINRRAAGRRITLHAKRIAKAAVPRLLARFDYALFPAIQHGVYSEGLPVTAFEALGAKVPLLACDAGGLAEFGRHPVSGRAWSYPGRLFAAPVDLARGLPDLPRPGDPEYRAMQASGLSWLRAARTDWVWRELARMCPSPCEPE